MRKIFLLSSFLILLFIALLVQSDRDWIWLLLPVLPLILLGLYDIFQKKHAILRNFPVIGHLRYFFEFISPEIQQYFIERNTDGRPYSRHERSLAYQRAKGEVDTRPFGTQNELNNSHYEGLRHSIFPLRKEQVKEMPRITFGAGRCAQPYSASILNVSAMSFGALSHRAVEALSRGAALGNFYVNTGEGGLSQYHLAGGGDLVWQIGTAYFGCRDGEGNFDPEKFRKAAARPEVKMIEIKLSQGAKPGHGGVLPASKNTPEIARIRGVAAHTTIISPPGHTAFSDVEGLLAFVERLRELSGGKPVGFKLCIGRTEEFDEICRRMAAGGPIPDFITIDGAEGGTGAAPAEFSDSVGIPVEPALIFAHKTLSLHGVRDKVRLIASGKVLTAHRMLKLIALGADTCNAARAFMFSIGCIQALRCNVNTCPTGVATQNEDLIKGLDVAGKSVRAANFHRSTLETARELMAAIGVSCIEDVEVGHFIKGDEFESMTERYFPDSLIPYERKWNENKN